MKIKLLPPAKSYIDTVCRTHGISPEDAVNSIILANWINSLNEVKIIPRKKKVLTKESINQIRGLNRLKRAGSINFFDYYSLITPKK
jgi:hypothetical protein